MSRRGIANGSDQRSDQPSGSFVYFIRQPIDDDRVKIGVSTNPLRRLREWGDDRVWIAGVPGTREHEQALHRYFAEYRFNEKNEWFWRRGELANYVDWLRVQPFAAKEPTVSALEAAWPQDAWLPWQQSTPRVFDSQAVIPFPGFDYSAIPPATVVADEYYTRAPYLDAAREVLGTIELDPASSRTANDAVGAERYYTIRDEALHFDWVARTVWLNPPFSGAKAFAPKLYAHHLAGDVAEAIVLLGNRCVSTIWFQPLWACTICFTDHRIHFDGPDGAGDRPDAGHLFVYMGPRPARFAEVFSRFGTVVRRVS